jgi:hypothetical protein
VWLFLLGDFYLDSLERQFQLLGFLSGVPVAKLVPIASKLDRRASIGLDRGLFQVPADFNDSLPADLLAAFEGEAV